MRLLAALYIVGILTWFGYWVIRKINKYIWQGIAWGLMILTLYAVFLLSVFFLVQ